MTTATKATHTPGPWKVRGDDIIGPAGNVVAECCGYSVRAEDQWQKAQGGREANARLIVTAVNSHAQLLEAVTAALSIVRHHDAGNAVVNHPARPQVSLIEMLEAAIAAANNS